jgi:hypothetical protein
MRIRSVVCCRYTHLREEAPGGVLPAHGENIHLEPGVLEMLWLIVVTCPAAQLFADLRTARTENAAIQDQPEQKVVYVVPCS